MTLLLARRASSLALLFIICLSLGVSVTRASADPNKARIHRTDLAAGVVAKAEMGYEIRSDAPSSPGSTGFSTMGAATSLVEGPNNQFPPAFDLAAGYVAQAYVPPPNCRSVYFQALLTPGYLTGTDCVPPFDPSSPVTPTPSPTSATTAAAPPPSPEELALIAADRAMALAPSPLIEVAPKQIGLTGLDSFFWLAETPDPITATAGVPDLTVTAEARPVQYVWDFGDGQTKVTTEPGRPWTKDSDGSISHLYETKGRYDLGVEIIWSARWRADDGGWRPLGEFSSSSTEPYPVKEIVSVLVSTER